MKKRRQAKIRQRGKKAGPSRGERPLSPVVCGFSEGSCCPARLDGSGPFPDLGSLTLLTCTVGVTVGTHTSEGRWEGGRM